MQEASYFKPGEQLSADAAVALRRADGADAAGAEGEHTPGVSARGAGRVPAAEEEQPGGGGRSVQHAASGGQGAAMEGRQGAGLREV